MACSWTPRWRPGPRQKKILKIIPENELKRGNSSQSRGTTTGRIGLGEGEDSEDPVWDKAGKHIYEDQKRARTNVPQETSTATI